jgi:cytochrome c553
VACHGEQGISSNDLWPNIAGQKEKYMIKQIKEFKAGKREDALMTNIAKDLSDKEIDELAAYYSKLKGSK